MAIFKCPGNDDRFLKVEVHKCPKCQYKVEIFSDEIRTKCSKCKAWVEREKLPSCVDWCKASRECIGEDRWKQLKEKEKK